MGDVRSFVRSFVSSFVRSFVRFVVRSSRRSFVSSFVRSFVSSLVRLVVRFNVISNTYMEYESKLVYDNKIVVYLVHNLLQDEHTLLDHLKKEQNIAELY